LNSADEILSRPIAHVGASWVTLGSLISATLTFAAFLVAVWALKKLVRKAQQSLGEERSHAIHIGGQIARYVLVAIGLAVAISALGVDLSALSLFAGALGVGIGLGLRDIVRNFVGGIVLLFDRSIEVGDFVELDDGTMGEVRSIGPRATYILTNDNVDMIVPNASLIEGKVTNWTRNRASRRVHIPFRVALDTDKEKVREVVTEAARAVPLTLPDSGRQRTQVWLTGFGESALEFELVVWPNLSAVKRPGQMMAVYNWAIDDALRSHGIEIPLPQRELRMRSPMAGEGVSGSPQAGADSGREDREG
jgi:small-conductance mechanosensitive channel